MLRPIENYDDKMRLVTTVFNAIIDIEQYCRNFNKLQGYRNLNARIEDSITQQTRINDVYYDTSNQYFDNVVKMVKTKKSEVKADFKQYVCSHCNLDCSNCRTGNYFRISGVSHTNNISFINS